MVQLINTGTANTGNGDSIREAFTKVNAKFDELSTKHFVIGSTVSVFEDGVIFQRWVLPFETTFAAGLPHSGLKVGYNFTEPAVMNILNNEDDVVGSFNINTDGTYTITFPDDVVIPALGAITVIQPTPLDETGADVSLTLVGTITVG